MFKYIDLLEWIYYLLKWFLLFDTELGVKFQFDLQQPALVYLNKGASSVVEYQGPQNSLDLISFADDQIKNSTTVIKVTYELNKVETLWTKMQNMKK